MLRALAPVLLLIVSLLSGPLMANSPIKLRLLVWEGYAPEELRKEFEEKMSKEIKRKVILETKYADESKEFYAGIRGNTADIISPSHTYFKSPKWLYIEKNLLLPLPTKKMSNYEDLLTSVKEVNEVKSRGNTYGVPIAHGPYGLAYNSDKVKNAPTSWKELWDPKHKGKYTISKDQVEANVYIAALSLGVSKADIFDLNAVTKANIYPRLRDLAVNAKSMWVGVDTPEELKKAALATSWGDSLGQLRKLGQPWKFAEPKEGTTGWLDFIAINSKVSEDPVKRQVAVAWLNFVISNRFQTKGIVEGMGNDPVNKTLAKTLPKELVKKHHLDQPEYFKTHRILWKTLDTRTSNGFKMLWDRAITESKHKS